MLKFGEQDVALTHCREEAVDAIRVYLLAAATLINGSTPEEAYGKALEAVKTSLVGLVRPANFQIRHNLEDAKDHAVPVRLDNGEVTMGDRSAIGYVGLALQVGHFISEQQLRRLPSTRC